ncbi:MAG: WD40/YVTN/BNR-like repeat-containing protein, partial [Chloroflexota bacterium]
MAALTWSWSGNGLGQFTVYSFASAFARPDSLLIGGWNQTSHTGALYKSDDGGATWTNISRLVDNQPAQAVAFANGTEQTIFVGTDLQLWVSYDGGKTFAGDSAGACPTPNVHAIAGDQQQPGSL